MSPTRLFGFFWVVVFFFLYSCNDKNNLKNSGIPESEMKSALEKLKLEQQRGSIEQQRLHRDQRHGDGPVVWIRSPCLNKKWYSTVSICASELSLMNAGFITSDLLVLVNSKIQEVLTGYIYGGPEEQKPNLNPECVKSNRGTDGVGSPQ